MPETKKKKASLLRKALKLAFRMFLFCIILLVGIIFFIRSPWGQEIIINKTTSYISEKIDSKFSIDKFYLSFGGNLIAEGIYLEDQKQKELLFIKNLNLSIPLVPIIKEKKISINLEELAGVNASIYRKKNEDSFNYTYILEAFASEEDEEEQPNESSNFTIDIKNIFLKDISLTYTDEVEHQYHELYLGEFSVYFDTFNLQNTQFAIDKIILDQLTYDGNIPDNEEYNTQRYEIENENKLEEFLILNINEISLAGIQVDFSQGNVTKVKAKIPEFLANEIHYKEADKSISFNQLLWDDVLLNLNLQNQTPTNDKNLEEETTSEISEINWPEWKIKFNKIQTTSSNYLLNQISISEKDTLENKLELRHTNLVFKDFQLGENEEVRFLLDEFSTNYNNEFKLLKLGFQFKMKDQRISLSKFETETLNSFVNAEASVEYTDFKNISNEKNSFSNIELGVDYSLEFSDFTGLMEAAEVEISEELYTNIVSSRFNGSLQAKGKNINSFQVNFANQWNATKLFAQIDLANVNAPENRSVGVKDLRFSTTKEDLHRFLPKEETYRLPEQLTVIANGKYTAEKTNLKAQFNSDYASFESKIQLTTKEILSYQVDVNKAKIDLGKLLNSEDIGEISFDFSTKGKDTNLEKLENQSNLKLHSAKVNQLQLKDITLESNFNKGIGQVALGIQDSLVQANLAASLVYENQELQAGWTLQLDGIDLEALSLSSEPIKLKGKLSGEVLQEENGLVVEVKARDVAGLREKRTYVLHALDASAKLLKNETEMRVKGDFIDVNLHSTSTIEQTLEALNKYIQKQLASEEKRAEYIEEATTEQKPTEIKLSSKFYDNNFLREVILPDLEALDTLQLKMSFSEENEKFGLEIKLPYLNYNGNQLSGLEINGKGNAQEFEASFGFTSLVTSVFAIDKTLLSAAKKEEAWDVGFAIEDENELLFNLNFDVNSKGDDLFSLRLHPENLVLNALTWEISEDNELVFGKEVLEATNFSIQRGEQQLELSHELGFKEPHFGLLFSDFKVGTFTSFIKSDKENLASGTIKGDIAVINPFENWGLISDLNIKDIHIFDRLIGDFDLIAEALGTTKYKLLLQLVGPEIHLEADGNLNTQNEEKEINSSFVLNKLSMPLIEYFSGESIRNSKGSISANGKFTLLNGEASYNANLSTADVFFNLRALNADLYLGNEEIELNNNGLFFTKFRLQDGNKNNLKLSGRIENLMSKPRFYLDAEAKNFQLLNSTKKDNERYFGNLNFDATAKVRGDVDFPKINLDVSINKETNLTYVVPQTQLEVVDREGVVVFVNKENELDLFSQPKQEELKADVRGIDINALVKINPKATINVLLNERTGDNLRVKGGGDLQVNVRPNGSINLSGKYEASEGHFELNLYNLVKRRFTLAPNSSIVWSGDPLNADLSIRAIYQVETSPSTLMAAQLISESPAVQNRYRQQLPFLVYLDVGGEINAPELDFSLDMPTSDRSAIGGSVYNRITQINQQEDERNKQVFALLVLNQFYPESGSDGSQGGATALARNNINQALSDQLNSFSNKMLKNSGVVLNFDLNSYTDFQTGAANDRTELDVSAQKKLFNDRLVVEAGSQINVQGDQRPGESNVALGNVSIEYLLTRDERWRLRGFRRNEYENIIDGQLIFSGIALIFTKEFNEFRELWKSLLNEEGIEEDKEEENKTEEKKREGSN